MPIPQPRIVDSKHMGVRMPAVLIARLDSLAWTHRTTVSELIRRAAQALVDGEMPVNGRPAEN